MLMVLLHLSTISVWIINFDGAKKKSAFSNGCVVKMTRISASVLFTPYSKLYILTELSANECKIYIKW